MDADPIVELVDHLFRRQAGRMVSTLTSIFGSRNLQLAEDVVQDALIRALQLWPFQGMPRNPQAWLMQVAKNLALDRLRREASLAAKIPELEQRIVFTMSDAGTNESAALLERSGAPYIQKPFEVDSFWSVVRQALRAAETAAITKP